MKDLYVRVTIIIIGLCVARTATNPSRKSGISFDSEHQRDGHLPANRWSSTRPTPRIADTVDMSFHSLQVLFQSHTRKEWQVKHLDLSNHRISKMTLSPLTPLHAVELLNLSNNAIHSLSLDLPLPLSSGLPRLKVLLLQRNQLSGTPKGLWKLKSLQSLDLSFNGLVHIGLSDFHGCLQLESIYLKSNKICSIHPEAFNGLKKLQVVDLRSNALTTLEPIVTIALEFPHLELDLTENQWQCGESNASFQNVTSTSWREKWNAICNMSVGNEKPYLETPQIRISRDTHLPHTSLSELNSLTQSRAERPQERMDTHLAILGKEARVGFGDLKEIWPQPSVELRDSQDEHATDRKDDNPPDLALAICLSVFITFVVAFFLGAFARPYIDRLWQQRCLNKKPGLDNGYSNEGFYDDIEFAQRVQDQATDLHQTSHHPDLDESQNPSWLREPIPHGAVISERMLGSNKMDLSSQQSPMQCEDITGTRSSDGNVFPNGHAAHTVLHGLQDMDTDKLNSTVQDHCGVLEESHYEMVAQEYDEAHHLDKVMDGSSTAYPPGTLPSPINNEWDELDGSRSRDIAVSFCKSPAHTNTQGTRENREMGCPESLGAMGSQVESSEERRVSSSIRELVVRQASFREANAENRLSDVYSDELYHDPRGVDLPSLMPRWGSGPHATPTTEESVQRDAPVDPYYDLETNYESDSDEGSLFTLSSEGSDDSRGLTEEQASVESGGASQTLPSRNLGENKDNETSAESVEGITSERTLEKRETHLGNPLASSPDSCLYEAHLERDFNATDPENISTWPQVPGHKISHHEIQGTFGGDIGPQCEAVDWHCSLRDLEFPSVDSSPSPPHCDDNPSDPEEQAPMGSKHW
ncbi:leucine-rich repeat-containing protein 66 [Acomys russatus]|uniref:leucine-rich repeat-containing protein 66 n=1 Tax=Acomys russatus TaxID=60746 RepID=UPI0021E1C8D0|nr:leucine-rich repeat-containing protein 66 [Acomys russatus]